MAFGPLGRSVVWVVSLRGLPVRFPSASSVGHFAHCVPYEDMCDIKMVSLRSSLFVQLPVFLLFGFMFVLGEPN